MVTPRTVSIRLWALALLMLFPMSALAQPVFYSSNLATEQVLQVGYTVLHMNYAEHPSGPYLDTESRNLNAIRMGAMRFDKHLYTAVALTAASGRTRYDGRINHVSSSGSISATPYQGHSGATIYDMHAALGPAFSIGGRDLVAPFVGVGLYYWKRQVAQGSGASYTEKYMNLPAYVGVVDRLALTGALALNLRVAASWQLATGITTPFGSGHLGSHPGYAAQFSVDYQVIRRFNVFARARLEKFDFSRTLLASYEIGFGYQF